MSNIVQFKKDLLPYGEQFKTVLPKGPRGIGVDKFINTVVGAVQANPEILECNRATIYSACQKAAQDGLILDGREAALVKYNSKAGPVCQYMPMVRGLLKKIRNSGEVSFIKAEVVCRNDEFSYNPGVDEIPNHAPDWFEKDGERGDMIGVYAVAKLKDGNYDVEIMSYKEVEKVRGKSKSGSDYNTGEAKGIWKEWYNEMAKKTVLRRLEKRLPSSSDVESVIRHDNEDYDLSVSHEKPEVKTQTRAAMKIEAETIDIQPVENTEFEDIPI